MKSNRRQFLQKSPLLIGAGLVALTPIEILAENRKLSIDEKKIKFGLIGCKGMGWWNMQVHLEIDEVECAAMCDVDENVLKERSINAEAIQGKKPKLYTDYRKLLSNKDIDAVIIGTPDHWHCKMMVDALESGKHVYVEKPVANTIEECNVMLTAAKKYNKIVQVGQWQRSGPHYKDAIDYVQSGKLGQIRLVKVWAYMGWMNALKPLPDSQPPAGVDYKMWLGPAPKRPFNENRFHFNFRWYWDYAGGLMTDWGVHEIDIALFAMKAKEPISVMASGGKFANPDDAAETPDTLQTVYEYKNFSMLWEHATGIDGGNYNRTEGIAFIGNNGTLVLNRDGWEVIPETENVDGVKKYKLEAIPKQGQRGGSYLKLHCQNFVDAIKKNDPAILKCGIESGSIAAINAQMGNIAYKVGRKIYWDKNTGTFKNDSEANKLIKANYHNGWELPS